ncbi:helix-turn-helix transcriptional regulator [Cellulomonas iranensis]|uniref:helix-turn-helix transcriptional regulator n=1 Tax=Cellulomonas iranensis TaxID=76862 RepID=UPI003D7C49F9
MDNLMQMEDVATELRIPIATLRYWRTRAEGPKSFRLGRRVVYMRKDVEAWIQQAYESDSRSAL